MSVRPTKDDYLREGLTWVREHLMTLANKRKEIFHGLVTDIDAHLDAEIAKLDTWIAELTP